jgi:hypothetical protein
LPTGESEISKFKNGKEVCKEKHKKGIEIEKRIIK